MPRVFAMFAGSPSCDELHQRIERGAAFADVRPFFPEPQHAFEFFGNSLTTFYERQLPNAPCLWCSRTNSLQQVRITWRAMFRSRRDWIRLVLAGLAHGHGANEKWLRFETRHHACDPCFRSWRGRRIVMDCLTAFGILTGFVATMVALIAIPYGHFGHADRTEAVTIAATGWLCVPSALLGYVAYRFGMHHRVPEALRCIGRHPVELEKAKLEK
jgi:hypothetical protein